MQLKCTKSTATRTFSLTVAGYKIVELIYTDRVSAFPIGGPRRQNSHLARPLSLYFVVRFYYVLAILEPQLRVRLNRYPLPNCSFAGGKLLRDVPAGWSLKTLTKDPLCRVGS